MVQMFTSHSKYKTDNTLTRKGNSKIRKTYQITLSQCLKNRIGKNSGVRAGLSTKMAGYFYFSTAFYAVN